MLSMLKQSRSVLFSSPLPGLFEWVHALLRQEHFPSGEKAAVGVSVRPAVLRLGRAASRTVRRGNVHEL